MPLPKNFSWGISNNLDKSMNVWHSIKTDFRFMNILSQVSKAMQTFLIVDLLLCEICFDKDALLCHSERNEVE